MNDILARIERELSRDLAKVAAPNADFRKFAEDVLSPARSEEQWSLLRQFCSPGCETGGRLLEIGSAFGAFIGYASRRGLRAFGLEPGAERVQTARDRLAADGAQRTFFTRGVGETLPFSANAFDVVYSTNVLEHVADPQAVIDEAIRVLKPGGCLQFVIPNYGSWWDGHYGILWLPNMPKSLAKLYVRLYGRAPSYIDTLQLINRPWLERILITHRNHVQIVTWGEEVWRDRLQSLAFSEWATLGLLKNLVRLIHRLGLVALVIRLGRRLHWETPFILTLRKTR